MLPALGVAVLVSCAVGISLSFFQMTTRYYIAASAFMVLGVLNKFLTVLWNETLLGMESAYALLGILIALSGAVGWQLTMGMGSVKVRPKTEPSQSKVVLGFVVTIFALVMSGFVQYFTSASQTKAL